MIDTNVGALGAPERIQVAKHAESYYPGFDWLRAVLAITVMLHHDKVLGWTNAGGFAVQVFFALSGWLIGGVLLRTNVADMPRFYFNRAVRIWVPYYIALALLILASLLKEPVTAKWLEFMAYKATMVYNLFGPPQLAQFHDAMPLKGTGNHFWSVNAEEQFYLLAPLILVLAARKWGREPLLWCALFAVALVTRRYEAIVLGVLAAVVVQRFGDWHLTVIGRVALVVIALASAVGMETSYESMSSVCAISIVLLLAIPGQKSSLGTVVGGMSYPLYLNHWIGVFVANALLGPFGLRNSPSRQLLAVVLNIAVAVALYWWVDRRILAKRNDLFTEKRGRLITMLAFAMVSVGIVAGMVITSA